MGVGGNAALLSLINSRYPQANDLTAGDGINTGGFRFNAPSRRADNTYTTRIDWNASAKNKFFGRFNIARRIQTDTVNSVAAQFPGDPETAQIVVRDYTWVVGHTWTASPTFVNQITVGAARSGLVFPTLFRPTVPNEFAFGMGLSAPFAGIDDQDRFVLVPTIRDDVTWTKGAHTLEFGGSFKPIDSKSGLTNDFNFPTVGLGGLLGSLDESVRPGSILAASTTALANYDGAFAFMLGRYASINTNFNYAPDGTPFDLATGKHRDYRYDEFELYVQDNWRVRNNLTLNFGVRWHYYPAPYESNGFQAAQDTDMRQLFDLRQRNAALGISGDTAEPFLRYDLIGKGNNARALYEPDLNNFGPRFGFAYTPAFKDGFLGALFGDNRTVIRGGGSLVYDRPGGAITFIQDQVSYLFDNSAQTLFGEEDTVADALINNPRFSGLNTLPVNNIPPTITRPFTPFVDGGVPFGLAAGAFNYAVDQRFRIPYSIQYSLGFQRELPGNFILEASYVGRQGRKLFSQADVAQVLDFRDPFSGQGMIDAFNALQSRLHAGAAAGIPQNAAFFGTIPDQPWFENQMNAAVQANFGVANCQALVGRSCTQFILNNGTSRTFVVRGDTSDQVQRLNAQGLLLSNVGMSAQFGTNVYISNQGASSYDGMLVSLRKRFSQGLQFDLNYTWSHSIDNGSSIANTVTGGLVCDLRDLRVCRGNSDFDIRHLVNANFIYELPFGRGQRFGNGAAGWVNQIIGGWEVSGIFTARSGLAFGTTTTAFPVGFNFNSPAAFNNSNVGALEVGIHDVGGTIQFFEDPAVVFDPLDPTKITSGVLRFPRHGEIGSRNILRGPGFWNLDTAVMKNFKMPWSENHVLQIRWESFNAFNHNSFGLPAAGITGATFGQITGSSSAPREMQFAFRYSF